MKLALTEMARQGRIWAPAWFGALLVAGAVIFVIGIVHAITGHSDGLFLMGMSMFMLVGALGIVIYFLVRQPYPGGDEDS